MTARKTMLLALVIASMAAACQKEGPAERFGEQIDDAAEEVEEAGEDLVDAIEDTCEDIKEEVGAEDEDC